jgi:hypothetical protein
MTQCKAITNTFPPQRCCRQAKPNSQYCGQHDPKARQAKRKQEYLRREWLLDLREARGNLDKVRRGVCELAKQWCLGGSLGMPEDGSTRPIGAGEMLVKGVAELKEAEAAVGALLKQGRDKGWTTLTS